MPAGKQAVGERIYVFSRNNGAQVTNECVIDCHGEQKMFGSGFTLAAGRTVYYYVPQGAALITHNTVDDTGTSGLRAIATGVGVPIAADTLVGPRNNCPDYNLSKFQASTSGLFGGRASNYIDDRSEETYGGIIRFLDQNQHARDIVTIRNRGGRLDITLSDVLHILQQAGYAYAGVHCNFCRSPHLFGRKVAPQHVIGSQRPEGGVY